jgi:cystathionine beta-synthase
MRDRGFDQLPVLAPSGKKLVGLVTLGNVLSRLTHNRASGKSPVAEVMFDFRTISEVVTDPRDMGLASFKPNTNETSTSKPQIRNRKFVEITLDTPLSVLNRFFEWNSAAIVTNRDQNGTLRPVAVVTKVDLLTWMLHHSKKNSSSLK